MSRRAVRRAAGPVSRARTGATWANWATWATVTVVVAATAGCSGVSLGTASSSSSSRPAAGTSSSSSTPSRTPAPPDATLDDLANILIPAYCQMPATRLDNGTIPPTASSPRGSSGSTAPTSPSSATSSSSPSSAGDSASTSRGDAAWGPGGRGESASHGELTMTGAAAPVLADVTGDGAKEVVAQYTCDAGGTAWPAMLVVVKHGGEVVGNVKLGDIARTDHAHVTSWRPDGGGLAVDWVAYEGSGYDKRPYENLLTMTGSAVSFSLTERGRSLAQTTIVDGEGTASFATPTGKVACTLDGADVTCAVQQPTWKPDGDVACGAPDGVLLHNGHATYGCTSAGPFRDAARNAQPRWQRQGSDPTIRGTYGEMPALAYGRTLTTGQATCAAAISGVTCSDPMSGHGFTISGDAVRLF